MSGYHVMSGGDYAVPCEYNHPSRYEWRDGWNPAPPALSLDEANRLLARVDRYSTRAPARIVKASPAATPPAAGPKP